MDAITLGFIGLAVGLVELIKMLVGYVLKKKDTEAPAPDDPSRHEHSLRDVGQNVHRVLEWTQQRDNDGVPLGYFPRRVEDILQKTSENVLEASMILRDMRRDIADIREAVDDIKRKPAAAL